MRDQAPVPAMVIHSSHRCFVLLAFLGACSAPTLPSTTPASAAVVVAAPAAEDPYLWLEEITGARALAWAREQSAKTTGVLSSKPIFETLRDRFRAVLNSEEKIAWPEVRGRYAYNFWKDASHPRGVWRRTTVAEYKVAKPSWEVVLDLDALAAAEHESWVWREPRCLYPKYERCLVVLSRGGADAQVVREFDTTKKAFVDGGFVLPEAKSNVAWQDEDHLFVGTDFGPGSLTDAGYPRIAKLWTRSTPLSAAKLVFEGKKSDVMVSAWRTWDHDSHRDVVWRPITFYTSQTFLFEPSKLVELALPLDADWEVWRDQLIVKLRSDWPLEGRTLPKGAALVVPIARLTSRTPLRADEITVLYEPKSNTALVGTANLKDGILLKELEDVRVVLYAWRYEGARWSRAAVSRGSLEDQDVSALDSADSNDYWLITSGFTTPPHLSLASLGKPPVLVKQQPALFDAANLIVEQHFATSKDGTRVPYFQVSRRDLVLDGNTPAVLTGYGGYEDAELPWYNTLVGAGWLERGGTFVVANIRGGGEYGPAWHQAAVKHHRQRAYDDFIAVASDLVTRKVTSPKRLGIEGGSNGGLLVGVMLTERPDLFGAVVCQAPHLDMKRFTKHPAGASFIDEFGDPDVPEDWAAMAKYSPYQNLHAGTRYPPTLFTTSTRDDRAFPGDPRKMTARMQAEGDDVLFYENPEGGHSGAANYEQRAFEQALIYTFLSERLKPAR